MVPHCSLLVASQWALWLALPQQCLIDSPPRVWDFLNNFDSYLIVVGLVRRMSSMSRIVTIDIRAAAGAGDIDHLRNATNSIVVVVAGGSNAMDVVVAADDDGHYCHLCTLFVLANCSGPDNDRYYDLG